ncbi:MAG: VWA domain-containing protein [Mycobacterium sp.]
MTVIDPDGPSRFRLLASHIAGRAIDVAEATAGQPAYTDGRVIFVSADRSVDEQRREVVLQSALLASGSLDKSVMKMLRARPRLACRYLTLEGYRALAELAGRLPVGADLRSAGHLESSSSAESLAIARSRRKLPEPPDWFGQIRPVALLRTDAGSPTSVGTKDLRLSFGQPDVDTADDEEDQSGHAERSKILKLFEAPAFSSRALSEYIRKLLGSSRSYGDDSAGAELDLGGLRRARGTAAGTRPQPIRIHFADADKPGAAVGVGGALYPEWDVHTGSYRPEWCRVVDFALAEGPETAVSVATDDVLRRRLARIGLGLKIFRARPEGDELDTEALVDLLVDLRSGYSPPGGVYLERRKSARDLGVLILLDASGSSSDTDRHGMAVHEHQRQAAAILATTLEDLGDRVALYGFRSDGRHAVQLPAIKSFDQRFGVRERGRLAHLRPSGYTRLGAGIRGAAEILKAQAGTPHRLLIVLSDGYAYDHGYEGKYAEADVAKALEEMRADGVACLCLAIGTDLDTGALGRVFGRASLAGAATLAELSPRIDELFMSALARLSESR